MDQKQHAALTELMEHLTGTTLPAAVNVLRAFSAGPVQAAELAGFPGATEWHLHGFFEAALANKPGVSSIHMGPGRALPLSGDGFALFVNPIDSPGNERRRGRVAGFPCMASVAVLSPSEPNGDRRFQDILGGVAVDLRTGDLWAAQRGLDGRFATQVNGQPFRLPAVSGPVKIKGAVRIIAQLRDKTRRQDLAAAAFGDLYGWARGLGSDAYAVACVASGQADAFVGQVPDAASLAVGYALVEGAGGVAWDGERQEALAAGRVFWGRSSPVMFAASSGLLDEIQIRLAEAEAHFAHRA